MQPGGKIDPGETAQRALVRELNEELGISVDVNSLVSLGNFSAPAANEAGLNVHADLFLVECDQSVRPEAEIEEIAWVAANVLPDFPLAPLTGSFVLPSISPGRSGGEGRFPGSNVQLAPLPSFCLIALGSSVQFSLERRAMIEPAAPSEGTPAVSSVA